MKIITNLRGPLLAHLNRQGVFAEVMPYDQLQEYVAEDDLFDAILVDISSKKAEGVYTPRSLIGSGHLLPIIGVLDEAETGEEREFEDIQATFIDQGGLYLLKSSSSPALLKACLSQAGTVASKRTSQRVPVRYFSRHGVTLKIDLRRHSVTVDGLPVRLTLHEYLCLELLAIRTGFVVTKEALIGHLYQGMDVPEIKIVDVFFCRLRKKLGEAAKYIETTWGRGYILVEDKIQKEAAE